MKDEVDKLDINKLVNVPTSLNNLKTKVDDLDVGKLKTVPADLKKLSDVVDNEETDYDTKIKDIEGKYFTAADYNKLTNYNILDAKIKQKEIVN